MRRMLMIRTSIVVAKKSRTFSSFSYSAGMRDLGGSIARQLAQASQWKYSMP